MLERIIAAFCIIGQPAGLPCRRPQGHGAQRSAVGYVPDPQSKVPTSAILTLAILAAMELGGKHNKALALAKELRLFSHIPSPSRWNVALRLTNRRLHRAEVPLGPREVYRGYIPSKRVYFHGLKLHLLADDGRFVHELNLTPGSFHDLTSLLLLPLEVEEGKELYLDRGYESHLHEDLLREAQGVVPMGIRRRNSRRYVPWLQYLAISSSWLRGCRKSLVSLKGAEDTHILPQRPQR